MTHAATWGVLLATLLLFPATMNAAESKSAKPTSPSRVYVGTYTGAKSKGIYTGLVQPDGTWSPLELAAELANPSFLALHPSGKYLYAVSEVNDPKLHGGAVVAYGIDPATGKLTLLNLQASGGDAPCHLAVDATGGSLLVANYGGGSVSAFPIATDGHLKDASSFIQHDGSSVNPQRQKGPHAHGIVFDKDNRLALVADLGIDKVVAYKFDPAKSDLDFNGCATAEVKPGAGPRHAAFHPNGKTLYVVNELDSTVSVFGCSSLHGKLKLTQALSTLPADFHGESFCAELEVHPSGKFLYASNRGHNSLAIFSVKGGGKLEYVKTVPCPGKTPRHFKIDPSGRFLCAEMQDSDLIVTYTINQKTGDLAETGQKVEVGAPVCLVFVPQS